MAFLLAAGAGALVCAQAHASTVWLCHPGQKADPCTRSLSFTAVNGSLSARKYGVGARRAQPIDCFYVYPSVSTENRGNSDLKPGLEETDTAWLQASWFSPLCRVFEPTQADCEWVDLPEQFGFLYWLVRPVRLTLRGAERSRRSAPQSRRGDPGAN